MGDLAAPATAAGALLIQVVPPNAEFKGPFTSSTKSNHTITNTSATKVCVKVKVFDAKVLLTKPTCTFMAPAQQLPLTLQHASFEHKPGDASYATRKVGLFHIEAPDTATDPAAFAKDVPAANWKVLKMNIEYAVGGGAPEAAKKSAAAKGPEAATKSGAAKAPAGASKSAAAKAAEAAPAAPPAEAPPAA